MSAPSAALEARSRPRGEGLRVVARNPQRVRQVRAVELVPQAQLDDFPVPRVQPRQRRRHHLALLGLDQRQAEIGGRLAGAELVVGEGDGGTVAMQPATALVPGHGVQPRAQRARVTQQRELHLRHHEGVPDRSRGVSGLAQQRPAISVQRRGKLIVGCRQRRRIALNDRGHQVPVTHAINAMASRAFSD